ncbi:MAG: ASCH domain-containing protein [archaeon]
MKTLSLKQPYAELILQGRKKIELRKWNTSFRGEFLIHASRKPDSEAMKRFGFEELPCGFIVGKAKLVGVKRYSNEEEHNKDKDLHLAASNWGDYGFIIEKPERMEKIPAKGKLGFWDFDLDNAKTHRKL